MRLVHIMLECSLVPRPVRVHNITLKLERGEKLEDCHVNDCEVDVGKEPIRKYVLASFHLTERASASTQLPPSTLCPPDVIHNNRPFLFFTTLIFC